jgi:hypothetical protein
MWDNCLAEAAVVVGTFFYTLLSKCQGFGFLRLQKTKISAYGILYLQNTTLGAHMRILVLPGDGIGPEITEATLRVLEAVNAPMGLGITTETADIGLKALAEQGSTLSDSVMARIPQVEGVILGPVSHYEYPTRDKGGINPSNGLGGGCCRSSDSGRSRPGPRRRWHRPAGRPPRI